MTLLRHIKTDSSHSSDKWVMVREKEGGKEGGRTDQGLGGRETDSDRVRRESHR